METPAISTPAAARPPSRLDEIHDLYGYHAWAAARLIEAVGGLDPAQRRRDMGSSFPSIAATLAHMVASDWVWLQRWNGNSPPGPPDGWDPEDLDLVVRTYRDVEVARDAFLGALSGSDLDRAIAYRNTRGDVFEAPLWQLLRHVVNHASYHRGQIATMMRQLGIVPPTVDLVAYHRAAKGSSVTGDGDAPARARADAFLHAVATGDADEATSMLDADPALAAARRPSGESAVLLALYGGHPELARVLADRSGGTDLFESAAVGDAERAAEILDADPGAVQGFAPDGHTALGLAAFFGHAGVVDLLLARGADPRRASRNAMRVTPIHAAVAGPESGTALRMVRSLLAAGGDPDAVQDGGWVPLHQAAARGDAPLVALLLENGARPDVRADDGRTPAELARGAGHEQIAEHLHSMTRSDP